nr:reverse transcriptase domain-containing protein [Tanacetum cinerariifolium]
MSAMANTTPLVTIVTKPATNPRDADATPRVNIQDSVKNIMRTFYQSSWTKSAMTNEKISIPDWILGKVPKKEQDKIPTNQAQSAFDRLSKIYSPRTTKSHPEGTGSRDHPQGRSHPYSLDTSKEDRLKDMECLCGIGESYDDSFSHSYHNGNRSRHIKRRRDNESPLSSMPKSNSSDGRYQRLKRVWFDELPPESIDSYKDLKAAFLAYFMQQNKYVMDPVEIHNIKQKDGETIKDFMEHFKVETGCMKGALSTMEEMMITTTAFIRGEAAAASKKKGHASWKAQDQSKRQNSYKRQIEELVRAGKLSHLIKEIKQGRDQSKTKKKETTAKNKPAKIYMIQSWQRTTRQKVTQIFKRVKEITFPPLPAGGGIEGPLVIEAEIGKHMIYRMYVDGGSLMEILYEHCFNRLRPEIKSQMVLATTSLTGFSGETIWPLGQLRLLVIIGDANHPTRAWMNFMIVRSLSPYNGIIGRPGVRAIQAVPSTVHEMLKFPVEGGIVTICSTVLIPTKCTSMITSSAVSKRKGPVLLISKSPYIQTSPIRSFQEPNWSKHRVYVDNLVVKSYKEAEMMRDIEETFHTLRKVNMKLNPKKCAFGLAEGMFLSDFHWTTEAEQAFKQLKQHLSELPLLVAPKPKEELIIYLSITYGAISAVLMTERGTVQMPIYFISHALHDPKLNYTPMEKLVLSPVFASKRLRRKEGGNSDRRGWTDLDDTDSGLFKRMNSPRRQEGGKKALPQSLTIRVNGGNSLQAIVPYAVVKMCWTAPGGWIEAKVVATIMGGQVKKFVWDNIVCRFGISGEIVLDNGKQFSDNLFKDCLGEGIKSRLGEGNKNWVEELHHVLWAHRTLIKSSHGDTPFSLTYGTEAVIPIEIEMPTYRTVAVDMSNDASHAVAGRKLGLKWEGTYEVTEALGDKAYKLRSMDGTILLRTWNTANLKRCYLYVTSHAWILAMIRTYK